MVDQMVDQMVDHLVDDLVDDFVDFFVDFFVPSPRLLASSKCLFGEIRQICHFFVIFGHFLVIFGHFSQLFPLLGVLGVFWRFRLG